MRHPIHAHVVALSVLLGVSGCAAATTDAPPDLVGPVGRADGSGLGPMVLCAITAGEGTDFFRSDTMRCELPEDALFAPFVEVVTRTHSERSIDLSMGPGTVSFPGDSYPLSVRVHGTLPEDALLGVSGQLHADFDVGSAEELATPRGPALPFDVWTVRIDNRVTVGTFSVAPYTLALQGATLGNAGTGASEVEVSPSTLLLRGPEQRAVRLAVGETTEELPGTGGPSDAPVAFALQGSGSYAITADGLVASDTLPPPSAGADLVRCGVTDGEVRCRLVARPGVTVDGASASLADGAPSPLPSDGSEVLLGPGEAGASVHVSAHIASGIEGIRWDEMPAMEGDLTVGAEEAVLDLPFDVLHVQLGYASGVARVFFDVQDHLVRFERPLGGAFDSQTDLRISMDSSRADLFVAMSAGDSSLTGTLTVMEDAGIVHEHEDVVLEQGAYFISPAGLSQPTVEPGAVLVRCFLDEAGSLACFRDESAPILSARLELTLAAGRLTPIDVRPGAHNIVSLAGLLPTGPIDVALTVTLAGSGEPLTASATVTDITDLPESAPLQIVAP